MNRLKQLWSNLRSSLWFVPVLIVVCSVGLAVGFIEVDGRINRELLAEYPRIFGAGADGSRGMLSAIAGSMITIAGHGPVSSYIHEMRLVIDEGGSDSVYVHKDLWGHEAATVKQGRFWGWAKHLQEYSWEASHS